jgi:hypothetical protein
LVCLELDLLAAEAVGYPLRRELSPFEPLRVVTPASGSDEVATLPEGATGVAYDAALQASGGVPSYDWEVTEGALPSGVTLDTFRGTIRGTPSAPGLYETTLALRDSLGAVAPSIRVRMAIR